jgi:hypothetical protein
MPNVRRCDSCGTESAGDDDLISVQRVYLLAPPEGTVGGDQVRVLDDIEAWCFVCRTMYPHQAIATD